GHRISLSRNLQPDGPGRGKVWHHHRKGISADLARGTGTGAWWGALAAQPRSMLQPAEGRAAAAQARRTASLDHEHPPRSDFGPRGCWENRMGREVRPAQDQP